MLLSLVCCIYFYLNHIWGTHLPLYTQIVLAA